MWFGMLIKVHLNSDSILGPRFEKNNNNNNKKKKPTRKKKQHNDGPSFQLNDYNILRVIMRFRCE